MRKLCKRKGNSLLLLQWYNKTELVYLHRCSLTHTHTHKIPLQTNNSTWQSLRCNTREHTVSYKKGVEAEDRSIMLLLTVAETRQ